MIPAFEMEMVPRTYECGIDGRMRLNDLLKHLQEIASSHADRMGLGMKWMIANGYIWVLVDLKLGIERMPKWNETCTIFTIPSGYDENRAYREFMINDAYDNTIVLGSSIWMVLDLRKKRPIPTAELDFKFPSTGKRNFEKFQREIEFGDIYLINSLMVGQSSIDLNGHVNNTEYVRWAMDALSSENTLRRLDGEILLSYTAEVFKGDRINMFMGSQNDKAQVILKKEGSEKTAFSLTRKG